MSDQEFEYDVFLSHAGEDIAWSEMLAERLRNEGVRVWFDKWQMQPGDNLLAKINDGLARSRKMVAVWSTNYFRDKKIWTRVEAFSQQHGDPLSQERPIIPLLIEDCTILPTFRNILFIDFRNKPDFDLRFRQLLQALDLPQQLSLQPKEAHLPKNDPEKIHFERTQIPRFDEFTYAVADLYHLLGCDVRFEKTADGKDDILLVETETLFMRSRALLLCRNGRITPRDHDDILFRFGQAQQQYQPSQSFIVSSNGFTASTHSFFQGAKITGITYPELLNKLIEVHP